MKKLYTRAEFLRILATAILLILVSYSVYEMYLRVSPTLQFWLVLGALIFALLALKYIVGLSTRIIRSFESKLSPEQNAIYRTGLSGANLLFLMYLGYLIFTALKERPAEVLGVFLVMFTFYLKDIYHNVLRDSKNLS